MNTDKTKNISHTNQEVNQTATPVQRIPRPGSLATVLRVRQELARLYRDARLGLIPTQDASRLCYMLRSLVDIINATPPLQQEDGFDRLVMLIERDRAAGKYDCESEGETDQEAETSADPDAKRPKASHQVTNPTQMATKTITQKGTEDE